MLLFILCAEFIHENECMRTVAFGIFLYIMCTLVHAFMSSLLMRWYKQNQVRILPHYRLNAANILSECAGIPVLYQNFLATFSQVNLRKRVIMSNWMCKLYKYCN